MLSVLVLVCCGSSAHADFVATTPPCDSGAISGFAVSGQTWLVLCATPSAPFPQYSTVSSTVVRRTHDSGVSWSTVAWDPSLIATGPPRLAGISVGPDGSFYLGAVLATSMEGHAGRVVRLDPDATGMTVLPGDVPVPGTIGQARMSAPVIDGTGRMLAVFSNGQTENATMVLAQREGNGSWTVISPSVPVENSTNNLSVRIRGDSIYVGGSYSDIYRVEGATLVPVSSVPAYDEGGVRLDQDGLSLDGGVSHLQKAGRPPRVQPVEGSATLVRRRSALLQRHGSVFVPLPLALPSGDSPSHRTIAVDDRLIDLTDESSYQQLQGNPADNVIAVHTGPLPAAPLAYGLLREPFGGWLMRANRFRAQAQLPGLVGDSAISAAAENHSRYWTLNGPIQSPHSETPGRPGFTGQSMKGRCEAVGTDCNSEIMYSSKVDVVETWIATPFHRSLLMNPLSAKIGGGQVGDGPAVVDGVMPESSGLDGGVLVAPVMFPSGSYDGLLGFSGEDPDPGAMCSSRGQPISAPFGLTVSVWVPGGSLGDVTVAPRGGAPLRGCTMSGDIGVSPDQADFVPDASLVPHTTYVAHVTWTPTAQVGARDLSWEFTTGDGAVLSERAPGNGGGGSVSTKRCVASARLPSRTVRRHRSVMVRYRTCARSTISFRIYRIGKHDRVARRTSARATVKVRSAKSGTLRAPTRHLKSGRYRLKISVSGKKTLRVAATVRVR